MKTMKELAEYRQKIAKGEIKLPFTFKDFFNNIIEEKFKKYDSLIVEGPINLGYIRKDEYQTIYDKDNETEFVDKLLFNGEEFGIYFDKKTQTFFLIRNDICVADLIIHKKIKDLYVVFPWQDPNYKGLLRHFYKYLLKKGFNRIISDNAQSINAFNMWKKFLDDKEVVLTVINTDTGEEFKVDELDSYFGNNKHNYKFSIKLL